jgi:hypothetical protein
MSCLQQTVGGQQFTVGTSIHAEFSGTSNTHQALRNSGQAVGHRVWIVFVKYIVFYFFAIYRSASNG